MEKIKIVQFGETTNYLQLMAQTPAIFARIVALEDTVNQLIEKINGYELGLQSKKANPAGSDQRASIPASGHEQSHDRQVPAADAGLSAAPKTDAAGSVSPIPGRAS